MTKIEDQDSKHDAVQRQPYQPPKASLVPLKLEERMLGCGKYATGYCYTADYS